MAVADGSIRALLMTALNYCRHASTVLLIFWLAFLMARAVWLIAAGPNNIVEPASSSNNSTAPRTSTVDTSILLSATPFRSTPPQASRVASASTAPPETTLDLKLNGVITNGEGSGVAFISNENGEQFRYFQGDPILGMSGVTIDQIYADGVVLSRDGRVEKLTTRDETEGPAITPAYQSDLTNTVGERDSGKVKEQSRYDHTHAPVLQKMAQLTDARQSPSVQNAMLMRSEMLNFLQWARLDVQTQESVPGVTVFPTNSTIFKKSGLRSRDVIQSIAGIRLEEGLDYVRLFEDIEAEEKIELRLLRNGTPVELTIRMISE